MRSVVERAPGATSSDRTDHQKIRTGFGADAIAEALIDNLHYLQAKQPQHATRNDWYMALAYTVRDPYDVPPRSMAFLALPLPNAGADDGGR